LKSSQDRINDVGPWEEMMEPENLLFVGAGFSFNAGLPLATEFTSQLLNTERLKLDGPSNALVRFVSQFVDHTFAEGRTASPEDWPQLEDVFTLVDLSANTGHHLGTYSAADLRLVRRAMIVRMIRMLMQRYKAGQKARDPNWQLLESFFDEFNEKRTAVLSMNWDTVIESGLSRTQSIDKIEYGCEAKFVEFTSNEVVELVHRAGRRTLHLTKPHGSINWLYCDSCRSVFWVAPSSVPKIADTLFRQRDWQEVRRLTGLRRPHNVREPACPHCEVKALGTRFATFSFRKALDFPMHAASWRTAEGHMRVANNWIFFGYSMPNADFEFKYLLKRVQLAGNPRPNITVITGGDGGAETVKRFERFFGDVSGERHYFRDGLNEEVLDHLRSIGVMGSTWLLVGRTRLSATRLVSGSMRKRGAAYPAAQGKRLVSE
jgi:NAD-dependent SIR2 family protein deacetylase